MSDKQTALNSLANSALSLWDIPEDASATLINVSENTTYLVEAKDFKAVLRVHREDYHSDRAIECELAWSDSLSSKAGIETPTAYVGRNGQVVQTASVEGLSNPRNLVLFHFIDGEHPSEEQDLAASFKNLGELAAKTHLHSINWNKPEPFERLTWNLDTVFGENANWGNWRDAPNVTTDVRRILERVERVISYRLNAFGRTPENYGLIHADMRLANLLVKGDQTRLIDFDDCGFGWFLYDFAASISFIEDHPQIPDLRKAWVKGYRNIRPLSDAEEFEIDTFIMLRRMALLAWIGSHMDSTEPQALAPDFARVTGKLGAAYLSAMTVGYPDVG